MDRKTMMEKHAREAYEKGAFNGTWLYAEDGENEFGRKLGMLRLKTGDGCITYNDSSCKKL